jgi:hypothetical protein
LGKRTKDYKEILESINELNDEDRDDFENDVLDYISSRLTKRKSKQPQNIEPVVSKLISTIELILNRVNSNRTDFDDLYVNCARPLAWTFDSIDKLKDLGVIGETTAKLQKTQIHEIISGKSIKTFDLSTIKSKLDTWKNTTIDEIRDAYI